MRLICGLFILLLLFYTPESYLEQDGLEPIHCHCHNWDQCLTINCSNTFNDPQIDRIIQENRGTLSKLPTPFTLFIPVNRTRNTSNKEFHISLPIAGNVLLDLQQTRIYKNQHLNQEKQTVISFLPDTNGATSILRSTDFYNYNFYGNLTDTNGDPNKRGNVALETRFGLSGLLTYNSDYYSIGPLSCSDCPGDTKLHYSYKSEQLLIPFNKSLLQFWKPMHVTPGNLRDKKKLDLPISLIVDHELYRLMGENIENTVNYVSATFNQAKVFFSNIQINPILVQVEVWNLNDRFEISNSIKTALNHFAQYQLYSRPREMSSPGKMHIFMTRRRFKENSTYLAIPHSICTSRSLSVLSLNENDPMFHTARAIALSIRDIFFSLHSSNSRECDERIIFNSCDHKLFKTYLEVLGTGSCLHDNRPIVDTCGNGKIDSGEECDPKDSEEVPCCNRKTCLADADSVCVSGECCKGCNVAPSGTICRGAKDQCDLPEFCSGTSTECPKNLFLENGHPCRTQDGDVSLNKTRSENARCFNGHCPTPVRQCHKIWGPRSTEANRNCYETFNVKIKSSCGVEGQTCADEHVMCGMLHCDGGEAVSQNSDLFKGKVFITKTSFGESQMQCKYMEKVLVMEGSSCGPGKYCFNNQCSYPEISFQSKCPSASPFTVIDYPEYNQVSMQSLEEQIESLSLLPSHLLPRNTFDSGRLSRSTHIPCSGRGLCTNRGFCLCLPGWYGEVCQSRDERDTIPILKGVSFSELEAMWMYYNSNRNEMKTFQRDYSGVFSLHFLIIILTLVVILILIILLLMQILRKKRQNNFLGLRSKKNSLTGKVISTADVDLALYPSKKSKKIKKEDSMKSKFPITMQNDFECTGDASEDSLIKSKNFANSNTTGVVNAGANVNSNSGTDPEGNSSIERIIKFGSMPSYKLDKLKSSYNNIQEATIPKKETIYHQNMSVSPLSIELSPNLSNISSQNSKYYTESPLNKNGAYSVVNSMPNVIKLPLNSGQTLNENLDHYENQENLNRKLSTEKRVTLQQQHQQQQQQPEKGILKNKNSSTDQLLNSTNGKKKKKRHPSASSSSSSESTMSDESNVLSKSSDSSDSMSSSSDATSKRTKKSKNNKKDKNSKSALNSAQLIANGHVDSPAQGMGSKSQSVKNKSDLDWEEINYTAGSDYNECQQNPLLTNVINLSTRPLPAQPIFMGQNKPLLANYQMTNVGYYDQPSSQLYPPQQPSQGLFNVSKTQNPLSSSASSSSGIQSRDNTINHIQNGNVRNGMGPNKYPNLNPQFLPNNHNQAKHDKFKANNTPNTPVQMNGSCNSNGNHVLESSSPAYSSVDSGTGMNYQYPTQSQAFYHQVQRNHNYPLFEMSDGYETYCQPPCESTTSSNNKINSGPNASNFSNSSGSQHSSGGGQTSANKLVSAYAIHGSLSTNASNDEMMSIDEGQLNPSGQMNLNLDVIYQEL